MNTIVAVKSLEKSFGEKKVVKEISFDVKEREILCLLGPKWSGEKYNHQYTKIALSQIKLIL